MLLKLKLFLIIFAFIRPCYQQNVRTTTNKDLTFCIQNHTMSNTLQTFWQNANDAECELESKRLIELYSQLMARSDAEEDQCSALLKHQMRKKLINVMATQLEEAFIVQSLQNNRELQRDLKELQKIDKRVTQVIWERVINEVYLFVDLKEIINEIVKLNEEEIQFLAFQSVLNKYIFTDAQQPETLVPLLTFHIASIYKKKTSKSLDLLYGRLPKPLRLLYDSTKQTIGLLNYQHSEYMYAPRDNGPDSERRVALTWSENKNSTDSDGHMLALFNDKGLVAFGNRFGSTIKYLYADVEHQAAYFWIGSGLKSSQWWQIIWPHALNTRETSGYIMFQNEDTKELLCATTRYDENRRYVTLLDAKENMDNPACYWLVNRF